MKLHSARSFWNLWFTN